MEPIVFSALSVTACAFLMYVFVNFHRELAHAGKRTRPNSNVAPVQLLRVERALQSARDSLHGTKEQRERATAEAAMRRETRRETLISGIVGLVGLVALFVVVMLLNSSSIWHH